MKGYLIFGGQCFYARGGFNDLIGAEDTVEEALIAIAAARAVNADRMWEDIEWYQIVDAATGEVVKQSEETPLGGHADAAQPHHLKFVDGALVPQRVPGAWQDD